MDGHGALPFLLALKPFEKGLRFRCHEGADGQQQYD